APLSPCVLTAPAEGVAGLVLPAAGPRGVEARDRHAQVVHAALCGVEEAILLAEQVSIAVSLEKPAIVAEAFEERRPPAVAVANPVFDLAQVGFFRPRGKHRIRLCAVDVVVAGNEEDMAAWNGEGLPHSAEESFDFVVLGGEGALFLAEVAVGEIAGHEEEGG